MTAYRDARLGELVDHIRALPGYDVTASSVNDADGMPRTITLRIDDALTIGGQPAPAPDHRSTADRVADDIATAVTIVAEGGDFPDPELNPARWVQELARLVAVHVPRGADLWSEWRSASPRWWQTNTEIARARVYLIGLLENAGIAPDGSDLPNGAAR